MTRLRAEAKRIEEFLGRPLSSTSERFVGSIFVGRFRRCDGRQGILEKKKQLQRISYSTVVIYSGEHAKQVPHLSLASKPPLPLHFYSDDVSNEVFSNIVLSF